MDFSGKLRHAEVKFLADQTYIDASGKQQQNQVIFNEIPEFTLTIVGFTLHHAIATLHHCTPCYTNTLKGMNTAENLS